MRDKLAMAAQLQGYDVHPTIPKVITAIPFLFSGRNSHFEMWVSKHIFLLILHKVMLSARRSVLSKKNLFTVRKFYKMMLFNPSCFDMTIISVCLI